MDPKTFAKLDPKLRETYERVMGTAVPQKPTIIPSAQSTPASTMPPVQATTTAIPSPVPGVVPAGVAGAPPTPTTIQAPVHPIATTTPPSAPQPQAATPLHNTIAVHTAVATSTHPDEQKTQVHESSAAVPAWKKILFIVLGIAFFGTYAIFWLLFFKVKLPF